MGGRALGRWWLLAACLGVVGAGRLCLSREGGDVETSVPTVLGILLGLVAGAT